MTRTATSTSGGIAGRSSRRLGISSTQGRWTVEGDFSASVFTDNHDYVNGATLEQAPIWAVQGHLMYTIRFGLWIAADANYWSGGRLTNNGASASQQLANSRAGLTLALPIRTRQVRFAYSFGAFTRLGGDFHSFGASIHVRVEVGLLLSFRELRHQLLHEALNAFSALGFRDRPLENS